MQRLLFSLLIFFITGYFVATHFEQKIESDSDEVKIELATEKLEPIASVDTQPEYTICKEEKVYVEDSQHGLFRQIIQAYSNLTSLSRLQNQKRLSLFNNFTRLYNYDAYAHPRKLYLVDQVEYAFDCNIVAAFVCDTYLLNAPLGGRSPHARARSPGVRQAPLELEHAKHHSHENNAS